LQFVEESPEPLPLHRAIAEMSVEGGHLGVEDARLCDRAKRGRKLLQRGLDRVEKGGKSLCRQEVPFFQRQRAAIDELQQHRATSACGRNGSPTGRLEDPRDAAPALM
jgi:hypothetical protein